VSKTTRPRPNTDRARRLREAQRRQAAQERRRRFVIGGAVLAVLAVVAVIGIVVQSTRSASTSTAHALPAGVLADGAIPVGSAVAAPGGKPPVVVDLYEDFQCPYCGQLEKSSGATLQQLADDGTAQIRYHVLSFIGPDSVRAANATGCATDAGKFAAYHGALYANQPKENSGGYSTDNLLRFGSQVGLTTSEFTDCVRKSRHAGWVAQVQDKSSKDNIVQTPTVFLNGKVLDTNVALQPDQFKAAILAAKAS
jgi:protein-disulfide isomerase